MQNDERDERDPPPDEPSQAPSPDAADAAQEADVAQDAEEADEFETASWPAQDSAHSQPDIAEPDIAEPDTVEPDTVEPDIAEPDTAKIAEEARAAESGPPPSEVEAYAGSGDASAAAATTVPAHSVPATTEPGESTRCPRCGTENRPGIAFCQNCGQRLVAAGAPATVERPAAPDGSQACPRCGTHNRAGVPFCQNCGANLRAAEPGLTAETAATAAEEPTAAGHALLGPVVLMVGAVGVATAWVLPFALGSTSLYDRAFGDPSGYGIAFWTAYDAISGLAAQAYFGFAAPAPILVLLLVALAIGGIVRARPAALQAIGLIAALAWALGLVALFVVVEVFGGAGSDLLQMLAGLSPAGIIFALASLIAVIGCLTRFGRG